MLDRSQVTPQFLAAWLAHAHMTVPPPDPLSYWSTVLPQLMERQPNRPNYRYRWLSSFFYLDLF